MAEIVKRRFVIGDEWIYFKIYTGIKTADYILTNHLHDLLNELVFKQYIDKWFFIRYNDPDFHLRLRILIKNQSYLSQLINDINKCLKEYLDLDLIWKIQIDTYDRELERYGDIIIENSESLFYYDSDMIVKAIVVADDHDNPNLKWLFGLFAIDALMKDFNLKLIDRKNLIEDLKNSFALEMNIVNSTEKQLRKKYQENKVEIYNFLNSVVIDDDQSEALKLLVQVKSASCKDDISSIINKIDNLNKLNDLIASHIHMTMNRLFRSKNRETELVSYNMLYFYYVSIIARTKYNNV